MFSLDEILAQFAAKATVDKREEALDQFSAHALCKSPMEWLRMTLPPFILQKGLKDRLVITITAGDPFSFDSNRADNNHFFDQWEQFQRGADEEDEVEVDIKIEKSLQEGNAIFVYDSRSFFNYLEGLSVVDLIRVFSRQFNRSVSALFFVSPDFKNQGRTNSLFFVQDLTEKSKTAITTLDRKKTWEKLNSISHFTGIENCLALPEDFEFMEASSIPDSVQKKFKEACLFLILGIVYDFTTVQNDLVYLKLNGYKTLQVEVPVTNLKLNSLDIYYNIYSWVMAGGNIQDKIGLARNLISLNLDAADNYTVSESVYTSILSGFKVYEKQNIKQYIELRNKMSDQLIGFNEKAGKIIETFAGSFQKSALAVVTLFASFIVTRVLTSHDYKNVFTRDAVILSFVFLIACLGYFFVSRWEVLQQKKRFKESYANMKSRNEDLLTKEDIQKILNDDKEHNEDVAFINGKQKIYSVLWIGFIFLFGIAAWVLYTKDVSTPSGSPALTNLPVASPKTPLTVSTPKPDSPSIPDSLHQNPPAAKGKTQQ